MFAFVACLLGILALLIVSEWLGRQKLLKAEFQRKFLHVTAGCFIAFWPWLISWRAIELLGLLMLLVVLANRYIEVFSYRGRIGRLTFGDIFLAIAVVLSAQLTHNKVFFALAILEVALADGLAAVVGSMAGKNWSYKILGNQKTVLGSMMFWLVSVGIFGAGLLYASQLFSFQSYYFLLLLLPPAFTLVENLSVFGADNLIIPLLTIAVLRTIQS